MKKVEADCPDSWIFEEDINKAILYNHYRKKGILWSVAILILFFLIKVAYYFFTHFSRDSQRAGKIIIGLEIVFIFCLPICILMKRMIKKYWPMIIIPVIALLVVIVVINVYTKGKMSLRCTDILSFCGDYLAFLGTFCLGYFLYVQDRSKMIEEKRAKIRQLITLIENANTELLSLRHLAENKKYISNLEKGNREGLIPYNSDWILYYCEYEALKGENLELKHTLNLFFNNVMRVNVAIMNGEIEKANAINERYIDSRLYSINKYNELEAIICLQNVCNDYGFFNTKSWIERKETIALINELCRKYYYIIENYTYVWLLKNNVETTMEKDNLNREIVDWLLLKSPEIKEKFKFSDGKRIISKVVFDCSLKFNSKSKRVNYIWGEYSLK